MNPNTMIVIEHNHPLYPLISNHYHCKTLDEALNSYETYDLVIDLSSLRTQKKFLFLKELGKTTKAVIISDLTLCWGEWIFQYCPQVKAGISVMFFSPSNGFEFAINPNIIKNQNHVDLVEQSIKHFSNTINYKPFKLEKLELGFHFPRVLSMIINEAYFALDDELASKEDIDLAMKNGVNYPLGPFEWSEKIGLHNIAQMLDELHTVTNDDRYRVSTKLKLDSLKYF